MAVLYSISEQYHEKKGTYIYVLRLTKKVDKNEFSNLREYAKDYDGYYSSYRGVNGFVFQTEEDAESFGTILDSYYSTSIDNSYSEEKGESVVEKAVTPKKAKRQRINATPAEPKVKSEQAQMTSGMPLYMALRNVIQTDGEDIIKDVKLINILDDFHAYNEFPVAKYILRSIIADGFSNKLYSIGCWNNDALQLVSKFVTTTGFIPGHVNLIFQSLAYGLGWINKITDETYESSDATQNSHANVQPQSPKPKKAAKKKLWTYDMDEDETDQFFTTITDIDHDTESAFGVRVENLNYFRNVSDNISLSCEILRTKKKKDYAFMHYALYDAKGRVASTGYVTAMSPDTPKVNPIIIGFELSPNDISRIRIYFQ